MRIVLCALAQSVYSYGISAWGGAYEVHLKNISNNNKFLDKNLI